MKDNLLLWGVMPKMLAPSAIPNTTTPSVARSVSVKRLMRLRLNWFIVGSVCGVGASFFMSFLLTSVVMPGFHAVMDGATQEAAAPAPVAQVNIAEAATPKAITINPPSPAIPVADTRREKLGDGAAVKELAIKLPNAGDATPTAQEAVAQKTEIKKLTNRRVGVIKTSLFQGGASAGIPYAMMNEIVKAYSYDVDFQRDIHPGDKIEVLLGDAPKPTPTKMVEKGPKKNQVATHSKAPAQTLRYVALTLDGEKHEIYRFTVDGTTGWYDASGKSIKKSLLATPVNAAHITSGFGMREHPLLGYTKFHKGVDFGATTGTPILAAGNGTVEFKGWKNGYGNFVMIKHNNTYETAYGHMSKFGKINVGSRVTQGQVIGYVGMTGMATGPHLHYEVHMNGVQVNPVAKQFNLATGLSGKDMARFKANKANTLTELASLAKTDQRVASR